VNIVVILTFEVSLVDWKNAGIIQRELALYNELSRKYNYSFTFITFGDKRDLQFTDMLNDATVIPIYMYIKKSNFKILKFLKSIFVINKIKHLINTPNIVKTNQLLGFWVGIGIKLKYKCPLLVRTGYDAMSFAIKNKKTFLKKFFYFLLTQIALLISDKYTVTTQADKTFLTKHFISKKSKILVMPNWVAEQSLFKKIEKRKNEVVAVGRLENQKNFSYLIKELGKSEFKLNIVGKGSLQDKLSFISKKYQTDITFLEPMNNTDLFKYLANFKFFVLPSNFEGNPKVLLEAMSLGCVVLSNRFIGVDEVIDNYKDGIIFDTNDGELLSILETIKNKDDLLNSLSEEAIKKIQEKFSLRSYLESENKLYKSLLKN